MRTCEFCEINTSCYECLEETIERVRMHHTKQIIDGLEYCGTCAYPAIWGEWQVWPCNTVKALDGEL